MQLQCSPPSSESSPNLLRPGTGRIRGSGLLAALLLAQLATACGASSPPSQPEPATAQAAASPGVSPPLLTGSLREIQDALGDATPPECMGRGPLPACHAALITIARDRLRSIPGQEASADLLDAVARRDEPDGEPSLEHAFQRARAAGGDAASLADVYELADATIALTAASTADEDLANVVLARGLPSPCPSLARMVPLSDEERRQSRGQGLEEALGREDAGVCALACPEARSALESASNTERAGIIVHACGPEFFGLARADDALLFAADPETLLAIRGLTHTLELVARVRDSRSELARPSALMVLPRVSAALSHVAIVAQVPASLQVDDAELHLPTASTDNETVAPVVVVLGGASVRVSARPWIGVSDHNTLVLRGDPIPGRAVSAAGELDAAAIAHALDDAIDRARHLPVEHEPVATPNRLGEESELEHHSDNNAFGLSPHEPGPMPVSVDLVVNADETLGRVAALLAVLDAARVTDAADPEQVLRPSVSLVVWVRRSDAGAGHVAGVSLVPRLAGAPDPRRRAVLSATALRTVPQQQMGFGIGSMSPWACDRRVTAGAPLPVSRLTEALGETGAGPETIELDVGSSR